MKIEKVAILVKKASLEFDKISNPLFLVHDLTAAQYKILKYLYMHQDKTVKMVDLEKYYSLTHPHGNRAAGRAGGEGLCHARREPGGPTQQGDFADKEGACGAGDAGGNRCVAGKPAYAAP